MNRRSPKEFAAPVIALSDALVKIKDRPWATTTLVFFDGNKTASRVRITLDNVAKQGKGNLTCIAEVSVH